MKTVVVIPAYKPDYRLCRLAEELEGEYGILIVDDGSGSKFDSVFEEASAYATVLRYNENRGKGGAMKFAFSQVRELFPDCECIVTADADGQHKSWDVKKVSDATLEKGGLVLGSRAFKGNVPIRSLFGNTVTRFVFAVASGTRVYDTQTGLRGFKAELLDAFSAIKGDRYEYEMAQLMYCADNKIRMTEVEIETVYENNNETSHFNTVKDSFRIYTTIYKLSKFLKYLTSSALAFGFYYVCLFICHAFIKNFKLAYEVSALVSWVISSFLNFILNRQWVFGSKDNFFKDGVEYYSLAVITFLLKTYVISEFFLRIVHLPMGLSDFIGQTVMYIFNYFAQKKLVFNDNLAKKSGKKATSGKK